MSWPLSATVAGPICMCVWAGMGAGTRICTVAVALHGAGLSLVLAEPAGHGVVVWCRIHQGCSVCRNSTLVRTHPSTRVLHWDSFSHCSSAAKMAVPSIPWLHQCMDMDTVMTASALGCNIGDCNASIRQLVQLQAQGSWVQCIPGCGAGGLLA
jgi:hypothetical protein